MVQLNVLLADSQQQASTNEASSMLNSMFNKENIDNFKIGLEQVMQLLEQTIATQQKPFSGILPQELAKKFIGIDLNQPLFDIPDALEEVAQLYLKDAVYFNNPRYLAHLNCPIVYQSILAELLATSINTAVETWDQSGGATFIEQSIVDWTLSKLALGEQADGVFTSGGTQSNLMAMLLARDFQCHLYAGHTNKQQGLPHDFRRLKIFTSKVSHFSIQKAAAILGLGYDAVVSVPCDEYFRMDMTALNQAIEDCQQQGDIVMAIVATAGTTDFGSIDPLTQIAEIAKRCGAWLHVDAAYGGGLLITPNNKHKLAGIECADSVTIDYHKSFFQPVSCSAFFVKDKQHLSVVTYHAEYLNPLSQRQAGTPDLCNKSIQTTRRFDALKLWFSLRTVGAQNLGVAFEQVMHLARQGYLLLASEADIEIIHQPQLSTLVFRFVGDSGATDSELDAVNKYIRKQLSRQGEALIAATKVADKQYLKFTLLNCATTINDIQQVVRLIKQYGYQYLASDLANEHAPLSLALEEVSYG